MRPQSLENGARCQISPQDALIPLPEARELFPNRPSLATLRRWCRHGFKGVVLPTLLCGRELHTTSEGVHSFITREQTPLDLAPLRVEIGTLPTGE